MVKKIAVRVGGPRGVRRRRRARRMAGCTTTLRGVLRGGGEDRQLLVPLGGGSRLRARLHGVRAPPADWPLSPLSPLSDDAMTRRGGVARAVAIVLWGLLVFECRQVRENELAARRLFGPAIGNEVIAGRADDEAGRTWLLAGERTLISIDLARAGVSRHPLQVGDASCWGLARLRDGTLWTLKGRSTVIRIADSGEVVKEIPLGAPHFGVFASDDRLIVQPADFQPPAPLLFAARVDDARRVAWGDSRSRSFPLARASVAALNMLTCGVGRHGEHPCWFPDEAAVSLMNSDGRRKDGRARGPGSRSARGPSHGGQSRAARSRRIRRRHRNDLGPQQRPYPSTGAEDQPGGWILARYSDGGVRLGVQRLKESARLILRAGSGRAAPLTGGGMVAEVVP